MDWFDSLRDKQLEETRHLAILSVIRELDALYLFGTIGMEAALLRDGTVLVAVDEHWDAPQHVASPWREATERERTLSLRIASERMPELTELLPERPEDAVECATCGGTGYILSRVACAECGAMGWLPPEE